MAALAAGPPGTFSSVGEIVASVEDAGGAQDGARVLMIRGRARQRIFISTRRVAFKSRFLRGGIIQE
jgi:hypothetical protein